MVEMHAIGPRGLCPARNIGPIQQRRQMFNFIGPLVAEIFLALDCLIQDVARTRCYRSVF